MVRSVSGALWCTSGLPYGPAMRLDGRNNAQKGYGARFDLAFALWWLRAMYRTPLIDRYAHHLLARSDQASSHPSATGHHTFSAPTGNAMASQAHDEQPSSGGTDYLRS